MSLHIHTAPSQPLVRYTDPTLRAMGLRSTFRTDPRRQVRCHACGRLRYARNLGIQVYYDMVRITCAGGCREEVLGLEDFKIGDIVDGPTGRVRITHIDENGMRGEFVHGEE